MLDGKKIFVIMPACNAACGLSQPVRDLPHAIVDSVLLVDDHSSDSTAKLARQMGLTTFVHNSNIGYGRNQKTYYHEVTDSIPEKSRT